MSRPLMSRPESLSMIGTPVTPSPGHIGQSVIRPNARRLVQGRGTYVDDISLPGMLHIAFLRSSYAHARIVAIDPSAARTRPGVAAVVTGADLKGHYFPWVGTLTNQSGLRSAPQCAIAVDRARWQGEPIAAVVANSRAAAEDAIELIDVRWEELPPVVDAEAALRPEVGTDPSGARRKPGVRARVIVWRHRDSVQDRLLGCQPGVPIRATYWCAAGNARPRGRFQSG